MLDLSAKETNGSRPSVCKGTLWREFFWGLGRARGGMGYVGHEGNNSFMSPSPGRLSLAQCSARTRFTMLQCRKKSLPRQRGGVIYGAGKRSTVSSVLGYKCMPLVL